MLQPSYIKKLEEWLSEALLIDCRILNLPSVGGGSINAAYKLETSAGRFFLKVNSAVRFPKMFESEAHGLELLRANSELVVPKPILTEEFGGQQFLVMDWLEEGKPGETFCAEFGRSLAGLHRTSQQHFGLDHSNYIGSLPQSNSPCSTWAEFYWIERLLPQIELASRMKLMSNEMKVGFDRLESQLPNIYPIEQPALIHGDLWSGNYTVSKDGKPCIFDPAVYCGHREMDLAMMKLFGGFDERIFDSYNESFPLEPGWEKRIDVGQLYPLMVHVNLFGASYCGQVEQVLFRF